MGMKCQSDAGEGLGGRARPRGGGGCMAKGSAG